MGISGGHYRQLVNAQTVMEISGAPGGGGAHTPMVLLGGMMCGFDKTIDEPDDYNDIDDDALPLAKEETAAVEQEAEQNYFWRVWALNAPERYALAFGTVGALMAGATFPLWGWIFGQMMASFYTTIQQCLTTADALQLGYPTCQAYWDDKANGIEDDSYRYGVMWAVLIVITTVGNTLKDYGFGIASEKLAKRVRDTCYEVILKQDIGFFDTQEHSVGALTSALASDAPLIQAESGEKLSRTVMNLLSLVVAVVISGIYMWPVMAMAIATMPVMAIAATMHMALITGSDGTADDQDVEANALLGETILSIRTVTSLQLEGRLLVMYSAAMRASLKGKTKRFIVSGLAFGFSQSVQQLNNALLFYWGGWCMTKMGPEYGGPFSFEDFIVAMFSMLFGAFGLGAAAANATPEDKAKAALKNVFNLMDKESKIDSSSTQGVPAESCEASLLLDRAEFAYPTRPDAAVFQGFDLAVPQGKVVAICGPSGSGKSTAIQLIERFYDPDAGTVSLGGTDHKALQIGSLRRTLALVSQEPVLFTGTIRENIAFGVDTHEPTDDEIMEAAKMANAHSFITSMKQGYDTEIGGEGSALSGGQKQRVAIARALVSKPRILLLDEATSALDTESERVVQQALDRLIASTNMTTVMIAHRLSTIQDADIIAVVDKGRVVESGSHSQLIEHGGLYFQLQQAGAK